jgi:pimeloyl-ACP methyl ester carboxylesterase
MMTSHNFMKLGGALSSDFTVYIPDRRGRGPSGAYGDGYGIHKEYEDIKALIETTGARFVFGLSSGAIVSLHAALTLPIHKLALYEPPLIVPGSSHIAWVARYEREISRQKLASALVTIIKGTGDPSVLTSLPRFLLVPLFRLAIHADTKNAKCGHVLLKDLIPTMHFDVRLVAETECVLESFAAVQADVLLLGGSKSAPYLHRALDALASVLPKAKRFVLPGVGHLAADNGGQPERVAAELRSFFATIRDSRT